MDNSVLTPTEWNNHLAIPNHHLLQSRAWGELKSHFGWTPQCLEAAGAAAQVLYRRLPLGFTIAYIPKGPDIDWHDAARCRTFLAALHAEAQKQRAIFLKVEPDITEHGDLKGGAGSPAANCLKQNGFIRAATIQPQTTIIIDISGDEDAILAAMKQKTRYNIRLAKRKGVTIRQGSEVDLPVFYNLARLTSARDGFGVHSLEYYQLAYRLFAPDHCALLIAEFEQEPLAALMAFSQGPMAYYFYGASSNSQRHLMPAYLIQWAAIRWAKNRGCTRYDLWGIPDADVDTLEAEFSHRHDGLWGVYRFKRGFGGQVVKSIGAFDFVYRPWLYKLYKLRREG